MSPFDSARFTALTEGLEISIVTLAKVDAELRIDAEYYKKRYLTEEASLHHLPLEAIGHFATVTDGPHGYHEVDPESSIVMLTAKNANDWFARRDGADPIATWVEEKNKRSSLSENDIILSTRGTLGMCAIVGADCLPANIDQDVARIHWSDQERLRPEFVLTYLNSRFGQDHILRNATGMVQQGLSLEKVRKIPIPCLSEEFQDCVVNSITSAKALRARARQCLEEAETILFEALGLTNWAPPDTLSYTASASDVLSSGRLDAEYFTPRNRELIELLSADGLKIQDVAELRRDKFSKSDCNTFNYIEIGDLNSDGTTSSSLLECKDAPSRATWHVKAGDIITSTVRPIRRLSAFIEPPQDGFVCSSGFAVLSPRGIPPEVLLTYLRLGIICALMDLHTSASMYPAISDRDILALPIKRIYEDASTAICNAVSNSRALRVRANALLNEARESVTIAIESSEDAAIQLLSSRRE